MKTECLRILRTMLGKSASFRPGQLEAIEALVEHKSKVLLVQRTGWGKSIVYFISTRLMRDRGFGPTLLISPLLSLMRNQIEMAKSGGNPKTTFKVDVELLYPAGHDSIAGVHMTNPKRCHYGHKINCMETAGSVEFGGAATALRPRDSFGALDFGRGHYPRKMFWYWATASGRHADGKLVGFNLGFGNRADNITENAVFHDGKITKINAVDCSVPPDDKLMNTWSVRDREGLVDLTFMPLKARRNDVKLGSGYSVGRPALGLYSGRLVTSSGKTLEIKDLFGLYEWVDSKW